MLNKIWLAFFFIAFISGTLQWLIMGDGLVFERMVASVFSMSKVTVEIAIGLIGALSFWLGIMKIAEKAGLVDKLSHLLTPLFARLMPDVPPKHPAIASMTMNLSANMLGLDNAATPMGIKAMQDLQTLNKKPDTATNAQILFLVLNTSAVTIFPIAVFVYRAQQGAIEPTDVFLPILLATSASSFVGLFAVAWVQKIKLSDFVVIGYFATFFAFIGGLMAYFSMLTAVEMTQQSSVLSNILIFGFVIFCLSIAAYKSLDVYNDFVEGAKEGFNFAISLIPYLLAMLVAIGVLRASGALEAFIEMIRFTVASMGVDNRFVDALPTAIMKPLSGSGARAMMIDAMSTHGADSFVGRLASTIQGSTETTFYVLAVYFGSVGIRNARHAISCGLLADFAGISAAIGVCYWFFG